MTLGTPYTAGIIDGEGSILLTRNKPTENRHPAVTVPSTTFEIINALWCTFGGRIASKHPSKAQHSPSWVWALDGDAALDLLDKVRLYLVVPQKIARANFLVNRYKTVTIRNGRYTKKELLRKKKFEEDFFKL